MSKRLFHPSTIDNRFLFLFVFGDLFTLQPEKLSNCISVSNCVVSPRYILTCDYHQSLSMYVCFGHGNLYVCNCFQLVRLFVFDFDILIEKLLMRLNVLCFFVRGESV